MPVDVVENQKRKIGPHAHCQGPQYFVPDVEIQMGVQLPVATDNPVVRIIGRILGWKRLETRPLLHAFEDEVDSVPVLAFHALQVLPYVFLLAYLLPSESQSCSLDLGR